MIAASSLRNSDLEVASFDSPFAFKCLIFLTFIMFVAPQLYFYALLPLHLGLVSAVLTVVAYVATTMSQRHPLTIWGSEVKLIMWLVGFAVISIPYSKWPGGSYEILLDYYLKAVIVFFLIANLLTSERRFHTFLWALAWYSAFNAVSGINLFRQGTLLSDGRIFGGGNSALTANPNDLALTLNLLIPFIGYLFLTSKVRVHKLTVGAILIASVACVILTYSRGGAVTLLSILLWYVWRRSGRRRIGALIGVSILIGVIIMLGPQGYSERIVSTTDFSMDKSGSAQGRWNMMKDGVRQTFEHPLGVGLGMDQLLNVEEGKGWNGVHNVYLQISVELGVIPGILFILLLWKLIAGTRRITLLKAADERIPLLAEATQGSLIAFAVAANFHPVAYHFYFYIIAGIAVALIEMARRLSQDGHNAITTPMPAYQSPRFRTLSDPSNIRVPSKGWHPTSQTPHER